jgi:hypothetical protein
MHKLIDQLSVGWSLTGLSIGEVSILPFPPLSFFGPIIVPLVIVVCGSTKTSTPKHQVGCADLDLQMMTLEVPLLITILSDL